MTQSETPTSLPSSSKVDDEVFSPTTQQQALRIIASSHGGLVAAIGAPVRDFIDWVVNIYPNPEIASRVIDARTRFRKAANDVSYTTNAEEREKRTS